MNWIRNENMLHFQDTFMRPLYTFCADFIPRKGRLVLLNNEGGWAFTREPLEGRNYTLIFFHFDW